MPVIYDVTVKTARMTATRDMVANGTLEILSAGNTVLAIFGLTADAGTVAGDTWTIGLDATSVNGEAAAGAGIDAAKVRIKNSSGVVKVSGLTAGLPGSGADLQMINKSITAGQAVELTSATFRHALDPA